MSQHTYVLTQTFLYMTLTSRPLCAHVLIHVHNSYCLMIWLRHGLKIFEYLSHDVTVDCRQIEGCIATPLRPGYALKSLNTFRSDIAMPIR